MRFSPCMAPEPSWQASQSTTISPSPATCAATGDSPKSGSSVARPSLTLRCQSTATLPDSPPPAGTYMPVSPPASFSRAHAPGSDSTGANASTSVRPGPLSGMLQTAVAVCTHVPHRSLSSSTGR